MSKAGTIVCLVFLGIAIIVSCALLGVSFDTLLPEEMALIYNGNTGQLFCDSLYGSWRTGDSKRYFVGLGSKMAGFKFNVTMHNVAMPAVTCKTIEGLDLLASVSFQYQLARNPQTLCQLLYNFSGLHQDFYVQQARHVTREVISKFAVQDMWERRTAVSQAIRSKFGEALPLYGATLIGLQLLSLDIANNLQSAIENTTVQLVGIDIAQVQQQADIVNAVTARLQAQQVLLVTVIDAIAAANATVINAQAQADALNATYAAQGAALQLMGSTLGFDPEQMLALSWLDAVQQAHSGSINIAVKQP